MEQEIRREREGREMSRLEAESWRARPSEVAIQFVSKHLR